MNAERLQLRLASILVPLSASAGSGEDGGVVHVLCGGVRSRDQTLAASQTPSPGLQAHQTRRRTMHVQFVRSSTRCAGVGACMMQASKGTSVGSQKRQPSDMLCSRRRPATNLALCHQRRPFSNYLPSIPCHLSGYLFLRVLLDLPRASLHPPPGHGVSGWTWSFIPDTWSPWPPPCPTCQAACAQYVHTHASSN